LNTDAWFLRGRLLICSPLLSHLRLCKNRNSTYTPVRFCGTGSVVRTTSFRCSRMRPSSICTTGPNGGFVSPPAYTPASMVDSIVLASEVSLLLLVPTSKHKTQFKCAKNRLEIIS